MDDDGWKEWGRHVLTELSRLSSDIHGLRTDLQAIYGDVSALKVKSTIWGLVGGVIPVAILIAVEIFSKSTPF